MACNPAQAETKHKKTNPGKSAAAPKAKTSSTPRDRTRAKPSIPVQAAATTAKFQDGVAEARLIEIYRLIGQADTRTALALAEKLVADFPSFALAQLVYGDLLTARTQALQQFGNLAVGADKQAAAALNDLRLESQLRLRALRERPPPGTLPAELLKLSPQNKHAIAVDASRARLYLFENQPDGPKLLADYYISVGKLGIDKEAEGEDRKSVV